VAGETPTPPQPGGLRGFWKRRSKWGKAGIIIGAVFVALIAIGLAVPAPDDSENTSAQVADEETTTEPTTTEETTTEPDPTTEETTTEEAAEEEADDGDTGRMSESEYDEFNLFLTEVDEEIEQFGTGLQRCGVLFGAGELAAALECMDDAYSGFQEKVDFANITVDDLRDDVAKECLETMNAYQRRLNTFAAYVASLHETATNLQARKFARLSKAATRQRVAYNTARNLALAACEPQ
jgi:hypothetical protein